MKLIFLILFYFCFNLSYSQHVYLTKNFYQSDFVVNLIRDEKKCDWVVYLTDNEHIAKVNTGLWYITYNSEEADFSVYITHVPQIADKKVCLTIDKKEVRMD